MHLLFRDEDVQPELVVIHMVRGSTRPRLLLPLHFDYRKPGTIEVGLQSQQNLLLFGNPSHFSSWTDRPSFRL